MKIKLELPLDDVNVVLANLGELPSRTGVFPVMMRIKAQADAQFAEAQKQPPAPPVE